MMLPASKLLTHAARDLGAAGVDQPRHEARILLADVLGNNPLDLISHPDRRVNPAQQDHFWDWVQQRCRRRPIGHILGRREFWSLEFRVSPDALDPRPDSECLVAAAVAHLSANNADHKGEDRVLDLGVGTGCLLLSVLHEVKSAVGFGIDRDPALCRLARCNAARLGLAERTGWIAGDWMSACDGVFDVILANPPYIPDDEIAGLMPEVAAYEPRSALAGGADGLECYRRFLPVIGEHLKPGGALFLEVGYNQADRVMALSRQSGLGALYSVCDLAGHIRCLVLSPESKTGSGKIISKNVKKVSPNKKVLESPAILLS